MNLQDLSALLTMLGVIGGFLISVWVSVSNGKRADKAATATATKLEETGKIIDGISEKTDGRLTEVITESSALKTEVAAMRELLSVEKASAAAAAIKAAEEKGKLEAEKAFDAAILQAEQRGREAARNEQSS